MTALIAFAACSAGLIVTAIACLFALMFETVRIRATVPAGTHWIDHRMVAAAAAAS